MPRGENPNSRANLKVPSSKEARKNGKKGGIASGEARAIYKSLSDDLKERCTPERIARINEQIISKAEQGSIKAYEVIRDGLGEKPKDIIEMHRPIQESADEMDAYFRELEKADSGTDL